ncbi:MAG: class I SAM-dependent methyltransferase [Armatimonadetes bacterium]|nr:class I SAM-dependent methyltransferase [Armatimonadota bacterium]
MLKRTTNVDEALYDYLLSVSLHETDVMRRLREETSHLPMGVMQIAADQGSFMALLVQLIGAKKTLEVGVFTGYSSLVVASALPEDGKVYACDVSDEWTSIGRRYWAEAGVSHKIVLNLAPGVETLDRFIAEGQAGTFDFAFIDADKNNYDLYYERALILLRQGGLIAVDNTLWHGRVIDETAQDDDTVAIRALNAKVHADERVTSSLVPIGDGVMLARKR